MNGCRHSYCGFNYLRSMDNVDPVNNDEYDFLPENKRDLKVFVLVILFVACLAVVTYLLF
jgi:hypothetical protein